MSSASRNPSYRPQLDGLRTFAVLAVWLNHWHLDTAAPMKWFPWGSMGVRLFFVLSGFLITAILIRAKSDMHDADQSLMLTARQFYIRRFLRIFPIYYFVLFVTAGLAIGKVRELFFWHLTYTTNFYVAIYGELYNAGMHFWTLAVEEQFYLVWPWVILLIPARFRIRTIIAMVLLAPAVRFAGEMLHMRPEAVRVLPIGCLDSLAIGSLLAAVAAIDVRGNIQDTLARWSLWIGGPAFAALLVVRSHSGEHWTWVTFGALAMSLVFVWIVNGAARGFGGIAKMVLEFPVVTYLGKISYGLYVYHGIMRPAVEKFGPYVGLRLPDDNVYVTFLILSALSIAVSVISWHLIEKPINNFKRYFDYTPARREQKKTAAQGAAVIQSVQSAQN